MRALSLVIALAAACRSSPSGPEAGAVTLEEGTRGIPGGGSVAYALHVPPGRGEAGAVVLVHGFARSHRQHAGTARHLAERGFVVLTPDMASLLGGSASRRRNVLAVVDHVRWLTRRAGTPGDALHGRVDPGRVALAGHSAGGAVAFMAAREAQRQGVAVRALCLLDAVPWQETLEDAAGLEPLAFCSLRSDPAPTNAYGRVLDLLEALPFPVADIRIVGASHVDPENPSDALASLFAGPVHEAQQRLYGDLLHAFLADAIGQKGTGAFRTALEAGRARGALDVVTGSHSAGR